MAVLQCAGCPRLISVSNVPGGNPIARANPEQWSSTHTRCASCKQALCDRCAPAGARTCKLCGGALHGGAKAVAARARANARAGALEAARGWGLVAIIAQAFVPFVIMMSAHVWTPRLAYWTGAVLGIVAAWKLLASLGSTTWLRILAALTQLVPLVGILVLVLLRGRAARALQDLPEEEEEEDESEPARPPPPVRPAAPAHAKVDIRTQSIDEVAERLGRILKQPVRRYSTYDFGREQDNTARSFLVGADFPLDLLVKMRKLVPPGLVLFLGTSRWLGDEQHGDRYELELAPGRDQLDAIRVGRVEPANHGLDPESVAAKLREYERQFGLELFEASSDSVRFRLLRLPPDSVAFANDLIAFCPDLSDQYATPEDLAQAVVASRGWIMLWWD